VPCRLGINDTGGCFGERIRACVQPALYNHGVASRISEQVSPTRNGKGEASCWRSILESARLVTLSRLYLSLVSSRGSTRFFARDAHEACARLTCIISPRLFTLTVHGSLLCNTTEMHGDTQIHVPDRGCVTYLSGECEGDNGSLAMIRPGKFRLIYHLVRRRIVINPSCGSLAVIVAIIAQ